GVHALDLDEAKRAGLVGETMEGYLAAVNESPSAEVAVLVEEVNAKRRAEYERIAKANGIEVAEVEALAAKKAIEKTRTGGWVRVNGTWRQK
ncbi:MAG: YdbL family protein, partial [Gammaproteobacteria bacterium]|nr:YdbL family protein [Gammaproteobacteria bacterium]